MDIIILIMGNQMSQEEINKYGHFLGITPEKNIKKITFSQVKSGIIKQYKMMSEIDNKIKNKENKLLDDIKKNDINNNIYIKKLKKYNADKKKLKEQQQLLEKITTDLEAQVKSNVMEKELIQISHIDLNNELDKLDKKTQKHKQNFDKIDKLKKQNTEILNDFVELKKDRKKLGILHSELYESFGNLEKKYNKVYKNNKDSKKFNKILKNNIKELEEKYELLEIDRIDLGKMYTKLNEEYCILNDTINTIKHEKKKYIHLKNENVKIKKEVTHLKKNKKSIDKLVEKLNNDVFNIRDDFLKEKELHMNEKENRLLICEKLEESQLKFKNMTNLCNEWVDYSEMIEKEYNEFVKFYQSTQQNKQNITSKDINKQNITSKNINKQNITSKDINKQYIKENYLNKQYITLKDIKKQYVKESDLNNKYVTLKDVNKQYVKESNLNKQYVKESDIDYIKMNDICLCKDTECLEIKKEQTKKEQQLLKLHISLKNKYDKLNKKYNNINMDFEGIKIDLFNEIEINRNAKEEILKLKYLNNDFKEQNIKLNDKIKKLQIYEYNDMEKIIFSKNELENENKKLTNVLNNLILNYDKITNENKKLKKKTSELEVSQSYLKGIENKYIKLNIVKKNLKNNFISVNKYVKIIEKKYDILENKYTNLNNKIQIKYKNTPLNNKTNITTKKNLKTKSIKLNNEKNNVGYFWDNVKSILE